MIMFTSILWQVEDLDQLLLGPGIMRGKHVFPCLNDCQVLVNPYSVRSICKKSSWMGNL